ncbi:capsid protein [Chicken virus mg8_273]|uniref:Capsid protein n=1 Tax=Chicken virus mg8_273 TaxID=2720912 RepID=A0A6G9W1S9_9VIRU|nr:capsid protein [Chicken virus mg8_273]
MARRRYSRYRRRLRRRRLRPRRLRRSRVLLRRRRYRRRRNGVAPARVGFSLQYPVIWGLHVESNGALAGQNSTGLSLYSQPAWSLMLKHPNMVRNQTEPGPRNSLGSTEEKWHLYPDWYQAPSTSSGCSVDTSLIDLMGYPSNYKYLADSHGVTWLVGDALKLRDWPNFISSSMIMSVYDLSKFLQVYRYVRVNYMEVTLRVPEKPQGDNKNLMIWWNNGRGFEANDFKSHWEYVTDGSTNNLDGVDFDALDGIAFRDMISNPHGMQWLWRMKDVVNACSSQGFAMAHGGWHSATLAYDKPVKIRWIPRHAGIRERRNLNRDVTDVTYQNGENEITGSVLTSDPNYATSRVMNSRSVPSDIFKNTSVWYTGPIVRLVDMSVDSNLNTAIGTDMFFDRFQISADFYCSLTFSGFQMLNPLT